MAATTVTIDCQYVFPEFAAAYLLVEGSRAAFIDNNTAPSVPRLLEALARAGLTPEQVEFVVITHVHLDHAGGTSALMNACPNATLLAHPRAAPHVIDPSKLVASARKVYGDAVFEKLYGTIDPIPKERIQTPEDGTSVRLGTRELRFLHTRGHANHHFCIWDLKENAIFTGDAFGLRYPRLQKGKLFIFPSTSPTDFIADEAKKSVRRIAEAGPRRIYPTHFGGVDEILSARDQMLTHLDFSEKLFHEIAASGLGEPQASTHARAKLEEYYRNWLSNRSVAFSEKEWEFLRLDLNLNAAGIAFSALKSRQASKSPD